MSESVYSPPKLNLPQHDRTQPVVLFGVIVGLLLLTGPIQGFIGTVVGILNAFAVLERTGEADPSELASHISGLTLLFFPLGSITGGIVLWVFVRNRREYLQPQEPSA